MHIDWPVLPRIARRFACAGMMAAVALAVTAEPTAASLPTIDLSATPPYGVDLPQRAALVLGMSAGPAGFRAQYPAAAYSQSIGYLGYFDADSCYRHLVPPAADAPGAGLPRFERSGPASAHGCGGAGFSGNAMNWATTAALDVVLLALTGGDRRVDSPALTVLQRATLPANAAFPPRLLPPDLVADAVPAALRRDQPGALWVHNCLAGVQFSASATSTCPTDEHASPAAPWFDVRVRVCDEDDAGALLDPRSASPDDPARALCLRYPGGHHKPVGQLQRHRAALRLGLFIHDGQRGALRSPLASPGAPPEWDEQTGVLAVNPEGAASGLSGVITPLHQLSHSASLAAKARHAGSATLFTEVLHYLQGLAGKRADGGTGGSPVDGIDKARADPYAAGDATQDHSCIRQDLLLIDGAPDAPRKRPPSSGADLADQQNWAALVRAFESAQTPGLPYRDGEGEARTTSRPGAQAETTATGDEVYALAGQTYKAHTHDIRGGTLTDASQRRPGLRLNTHLLDLGTGTQHDGRALSLAAKYGGFRDRSGQGNPFIDRNGAPDDSSWQSPDAPGEPWNYMTTGDTRGLVRAVARLFDDLARHTAGTLTSQRLAAPGLLYEARFDLGGWSGDLVATPVLWTAPGAASAWSAAARLDQRPTATRRIVVGKTNASAQAAATAFLWPDIDADLRAALNRAGPDAPADARGEERLAYLRGDRSAETSSATGPALRRRDSRLGAIVHSAIVRSDPPSGSIQDAGYAAFHEAHRARPPALFVGANDGMLHAFHAATGEELFAYIPSWLGPRLPALADAQSGGRLPAFVDATPAVAEAEVGRAWKTVLVGGTGAGGQGVYALDVSQADAFDASQVMWEFTDRDDAALGQVISAPQIRKFRINAATAVVPVYKWFAVVAGGVNHYAADAYPGRAAQPALFLLDLAKPAGAPWREGVNYHKVVLPADPRAGSRPSGVVGFEVALGPAQDVAALYAGDLHGQLWKLDFSQALSPANWTLASLSAQSTTTGPLPFFVARDADGTAQPLTMAPFLAAGPGRTTLVVLGTGQYLQRADHVVDAHTPTQSVYALYDDDSPLPDDRPAGSGAISGRGRLQRGTVEADGSVRVATFHPGRPTSDADTSRRAGWYLDLPGPGERQAAPAMTVGRSLVFASLLPAAPRQPCSTGSGRLYRVDVFTGQGLGTATSVGLPGEPLLVSEGDSAATGPDGTGRRTVTRSVRVVAQGARGVADTGTLTRQVRLGRLSWRQVHNYQETRAAP